MANWTESYGVAKLDLGIVTISVAYAMNGKGYQYSYGFFKSKKLYATMDEAKADAIQSVDIRLAAARREIADIRVEQVKKAD